jgi:hypothetical protein
MLYDYDNYTRLFQKNFFYLDLPPLIKKVKIEML